MKNKTKKCKYCQTDIPKSAKICPNCQKKVKKGKLIPILIVAVIIIGAILLFSDSSPSYKITEESKSMSEDDFKSKCETISYEEINRNPDSYIGKRVVFTGEVIQVAYEGESTCQYRINVTNTGDKDYPYYEDTVYVVLNGKTDGRILEDDIVTFYGEYGGTYTYENVLGGSTTVPLVSALYMELNK